MTRKPLNSTPLSATLQAASLLVVAAGVFGILVSDLTRKGTDLAQAAASTKVQLSESPH
jgi:hypothetical protein